MIAADAPAVRRTMPAPLSIGAACSGAAIAAWLVPASVQITTWPRAGAGRVAIFAPLFMLWWALAAAILFGCVLWFAGSAGPPERDARAGVVAPFAALWAWTIPFLPWLPDRFPLLLVLAGPLRWLLLAAVVLTSLIRLASRISPQRLHPGKSSVSLSRISERAIAFLLPLVFYLVVGLRSLAVAGLNGDEIGRAHV